jgi:hypothetical protein
MYSPASAAQKENSMFENTRAVSAVSSEMDLDIREGRFQRWLALIAGFSSVLSGLEVSYEHYRGSYSRRVMYTPVVLSGALAAGGLAGVFSRRAARTVLPIVSILTLGDSVIGFYFHVRGVHRKPGGWRLPLVNMVMGPPIFAPLLFGVSAYLGFIASLLRRGERDQGGFLPRPAHAHHWARLVTGEHERISWTQDVREGRFQEQMALATVIAAFFSGFEAWYSHYKNNFRYKAQWTPVIVAPMLMLVGMGALRSRRIAHTWLPAISALAVANGAVGFAYHARGVMRRPAGMKKPIYNLIYGPPIFAPLLFAASGLLGLLASLLRREKRS